MKLQPTSNDPRRLFLEQTCKALVSALTQGLAGEAVACQSSCIAGPRAGVVLLQVGVAAAKVLRLLSGDNAAIARQFIAWNFPGDPAVFMSGKLIRIEAPWPDALAQTQIRYRDVSHHPVGDGRWVAGLNERGTTIVLGFSDNVPHLLMGGTTGSGKTVALRNAAAQLSHQAGETALVALDGKYGAGLGILSNLPGMVGPVATDVRQATNALGWVHTELQRRYGLIAAQGEAAIAHLPRIVVLFDEFQEFMEDPHVRELTRRLLAQGRAARIHAILATQHPTVEAFGENGSLKRNLVGRLALRVTDQDASRVVVGDSLPRADRLMGRGDAYAIIPGHIHRVQLLLVDEAELQLLPREEPRLRAWPEVRPADYGQEPTVHWAYNGSELAWGLIGAAQTPPWGRQRLLQALEAAGLERPGSERADRLLELTRETAAVLSEAHYQLLSAESPVADEINQQELLLGMVAAANDWGRQRLRQAFEGAGLAVPGSERADRIVDLGEAALASLTQSGYRLVPHTEEVEEGPFSLSEIAQAVLAAAHGWGRERLIQALAANGLNRPGAERAMRLLAYGRQLRDKLVASNWELTPVGVTEAADASTGP